MKAEKALEAIAIFEELLKEGIITKQDFEEKKIDILNLVENDQNTTNEEDSTTSESNSEPPSPTKVRFFSLETKRKITLK